MKTLILLTSLFVLSVHAGIIESHVKWKNTQVSVCFLENASYLKNKVNPKDSKGLKIKPFTDTEKDLIIRTIESEYTPELTGIHFVGWENCDESKKVDAIVSKSSKGINVVGFSLFGPTFEGRSSIGQAGIGKDLIFLPSEYTSLVTLVEFSDPHTIAHEFGHLAGLRHEHIRMEAADDSVCRKTFMMTRSEYVTRFSRGDTIYKSSKLVTEYDPESVMSYCYLFKGVKLRSELLSDLDRQTLKSEYAN